MAKRKSKTLIGEACWNTVGVWSTAQEKCERLLQEVHCRNCDVFSKAGREVLERRPPKNYITQWQKEIAHQGEVNDATLIAVITFRLGKEWFAIPTKLLQEIAELRTIHRVPHNDNPYIAGIVNIGGEVDICYSLGNLLSVDKQQKRDHVYQRLMVVGYLGDRYIFPVSEISGMVRYGESDVVPVPATLGNNKQYIDSMFLSNKTHIAVLNIENVCQSLGGLAT